MIRPTLWYAATNISCPAPCTHSSVSRPVWCRPKTTIVRSYRVPTNHRTGSIVMLCICRQMLSAVSTIYAPLHTIPLRHLCGLSCTHSMRLAMMTRHWSPANEWNWQLPRNELWNKMFTSREMPSRRANSAWATKSSSWLNISCSADLLFKWQYFLYRFCAIGKLRIIIWKSASCVVSFNCSNTVYTKSVSPELVALSNAFLFSPSFSRSGTWRLDFGSNSRSWKRKKFEKFDSTFRRCVDSLWSQDFFDPIPGLSAQYYKMKCPERPAHVICRKFSAQRHRRLQIKNQNCQFDWVMNFSHVEQLLLSWTTLWKAQCSRMRDSGNFKCFAIWMANP